MVLFLRVFKNVYTCLSEGTRFDLGEVHIERLKKNNQNHTIAVPIIQPQNNQTRTIIHRIKKYQVIFV